MQKTAQAFWHQRELWIWVMALLVLFFNQPENDSFSLCLFHHLGIWCPGCGLGHSMYHAMHLHWAQSWHYHPLGVFAIAVIAHRIFILLNTQKPTTTCSTTNS